MLQPFPLAYLCFCLHHILSSLCHRPVQKALIYFSMAHFVKILVLMKDATCMRCPFSHVLLCKYVCIVRILCLQKFCLFHCKQDWGNFSALNCWRVTALGDPWQYLGFLWIQALCSLKLNSRELKFLFIGTKFAGWCLHKSLATPAYALNSEPSREQQQGPCVWADSLFLCI